MIQDTLAEHSSESASNRQHWDQSIQTKMQDSLLRVSGQKISAGLGVAASWHSIIVDGTPSRITPDGSNVVPVIMLNPHHQLCSQGITNPHWTTMKKKCANQIPRQ
jgi:hypothetical protein